MKKYVSSILALSALAVLTVTETAKTFFFCDAKK